MTINITTGRNKQRVRTTDYEASFLCRLNNLPVMQKPDNLTTFHIVISKTKKLEKREANLEQGRDDHTWGDSYLQQSQSATEKENKNKNKKSQRFYL